jgi:tricorn protease
VRNLTDTPGVHELNPAWSPDGQWIAYLSDKTGEYELYVAPQKGGQEVRVTSDGSVYRFGLIWSPDSKKLLYWDKSLRLYYVDIDERKPMLMDQGDSGFGGPVGNDWSPDSQWVVYTKVGPTLNSAIYLYSLADKKITKLTDDFYNNSNPTFDQNGKCLYFLSDRYFHPSASNFDTRFGYYHTPGIFSMTLQADAPSPFAPRSDEEEVKADKEKAKPEGDEKKPDQKPEPEKGKGDQAKAGGGGKSGEPAKDDKEAKPAKDEKETKPAKPAESWPCRFPQGPTSI